MYYRRKILLSLLQVLGNEVSKTKMQKLLFLACSKQQKPSYEFVPYKYGCYSFQATADKKTLSKYKELHEVDNWKKKGRKKYLHQLSMDDQKLVYDTVANFGRMSERELIKYIYIKYPYYAQNSVIKDDILTTDQLTIVKESVGTAKSAKLFTIGYEGITLEHYLKKLLDNRIKVLCDVRRNPLSMKYGFSKNQLKNALAGLNIVYVHMPELGIDSSLRKDLNGQEDYDKLFDKYMATVIPNQQDSLYEIWKLIKMHGRVALTCFEAQHTSCHRGCVASSILHLDGFPHKVIHL